MHDAKKKIYTSVYYSNVSYSVSKEICFFLTSTTTDMKFVSSSGKKKKLLIEIFTVSIKKRYLAQPWLSSSFDSPVALIVILIARLLLATLWAN